MGKLLFLIAKFMKKINIPAVRKSNIQNNTWIGSACNIVDISLDNYSYIGSYCTVINASIGRFCSIAENCVIGGVSHPTEWLSTSPVFYDEKNCIKKVFAKHRFEMSKKTTIGNDVWIGNNCLIKSGVDIGDGAVIGMGAVVTTNIGTYEIWGGNPARLIKYRFNEDIRIKLKKINWWNLDDESIKSFAYDVPDVKKIIERLNK